MLHKMIDLYEGGQRSLRPSNIAYNTVLNACAFTRDGDKNDAFLIAIKTYNELRQSQYCKPDAVSYGTLLKGKVSIWFTVVWSLIFCQHLIIPHLFL